MAPSTPRQRKSEWRIDTTPGQRFGELTVVREVEPRTYPSGQKRRQIEVECANGHHTVVEPSILRERPICRQCRSGGGYIPPVPMSRPEEQATQPAVTPRLSNGGGFDYQQMFQLLTTLERLEQTDRRMYEEVILERAKRLRREAVSNN